ncbi:MAG TPA: PLP-dependent aminotransferase family protein [Solirubrobacteraceae bacterium]|nr:PLP-dependent aminotransferase family protein [Solirubrobacteraceae bacterium]
MASSRATSGVELQVQLAGRRLRAGLEDELREAVREGRLATGSRLPSSRTLAVDLGVARNTVAEAYAQLVAEGWLEARHGAGTWVAERRDAGLLDRAVEQPEPIARFDLRPGVPDLGAFPRAAWLTAARRALAVAADETLGYGDPRGLPALREQLAAYLARVRRVAVQPSGIGVCAGFGEALRLLCAVLLQRGGRSVAVEGFGHRLHRELIAAGGLEVVPIGVDDPGAVVGDLGGEAAVVLTPAHQFPLGVPLVPARRRDVVAWAADTGSLVLEDDYDGEFRYDRQAVGAMQALAPAHVVYAGTAAKSLVPGLRLAWLVPPPALLDELVEAKRAMGAFPAVFEQLTLAEFLASGAFDRQVRRARIAYRRRRDRLLRQLASRGIEVSGIAAGLHVLAHLAERDEREVIERAAERGLALEGLGAYAAPGHSGPPALVIGYGRPPEHAYTAALARLDAALDSSR